MNWKCNFEYYADGRIKKNTDCSNEDLFSVLTAMKVDCRLLYFQNEKLNSGSSSLLLIIRLTVMSGFLQTDTKAGL